MNRPGIESFVSLKQFFIKKTIKTVLNTITFRFEKDDHEEYAFNGETSTFFRKRSKSELLNELSEIKN